MPPQTRFAAVDVGSNAIRIKIVGASRPDQWEEIHVARHPVRLGREVFLTGEIAEDSASAAAAAFRDFRETTTRHGVTELRCVATSALRESKNRKAIVDLIRRASELSIDVIEGLEEARLIQLAVDRSMRLADDRFVLIDIGGGSVELTGIDHGELKSSASLPIGTVRLQEAFLGERPVSRTQEALLRELLNRVLEPTLTALAPLRARQFVGTGGNFERMAVLCPAGKRPKSIDVGALRELLPRIARMSVQQRCETLGLRRDRADVIVPAMFVTLRIADVLGSDRILVPGVGLRDGVLREMIEKHFGVWDYRREAAATLQGARALGRKFRFDEAHGEQTLRLGLLLFDALKDLHGLGPEERLILSVAALLHDVGDFIADGGHHKHSYYVIQHSDVVGLSPRARRLAANVARYHRGAEPHPSHANLDDLSRPELDRVKKLAAIVRIADALDREHREKVRDVAVTVDKKRVVLHLEGHHDLSLERWTVERKAPFFEQVFGRSVETEITEGPN